MKTNDTLKFMAVIGLGQGIELYVIGLA